MSNATAEYYKDYWLDETDKRNKRAYYERLYSHIRSRICLDPSWHVLDVAGGNGHLLQYLGVAHADILDISESGLLTATASGYTTFQGDVQRRFPFAEQSYDAALCFEVLEHLPFPGKTLAEINNVLKPGGVLYVGQPNMRADGVHHVRRYYLKPLLDDLKKAGFGIEWVDHVPAYSMRDSIVSDIRNNPSILRRMIQCVNLSLSMLPRPVRYVMAKAWPDRFSLILVVKAVKSNE